MKRFIIPFIIAFIFHVALVWGNFDFLKNESIVKPQIKFMTMTLSHIEKPKPVIKPQKKRVKKKTQKKIIKKKVIAKKPVAKPEKNISTKASIQKEVAVKEEEPPKEIKEESKKAETSIQKASPMYKHNPSPKYPGVARKRGWQGVVEIEVIVDKHGTARSLKIVKSSGFSILDKSALKTVKTWRFNPGRNGNEIIEMAVIVPVKFSLTG